METDTILIGTFNGKNKLGFKKEQKYLIKIKEEKRRGYLVFGTDDLENFTNKFFCPYSSEISIKNDWSFDYGESNDSKLYN